MLTERFNNALIFAAEKHQTQVRKGSNAPYISHLLGVASLVLEHGGDEDEAIGALLHDAIEDQDVTKEDIAEKFGGRAAAIVEACTDGVPDKTSGEKPPWRARKEAYIAHIDSSQPSFRLVSVADKLHNARAIITDYRTHGEELWSRFKGGRESLWYYRALCNRYREVARKDDPPGLTALLAEFEAAVDEMERIAAAEG